MKFLGKIVLGAVGFIISLFVILTVVGRLSGPTETSRAAGVSARDCRVHTRGGFTAVVVCPPSLGPAAWRAAGRAACEGRRACNAWIWEDAGQAPAVAPGFATPMTEAQAESAVAVWVHPARRLDVRAAGRR